MVILGGAFKGVEQVLFDGVENPWNFDGHSSLARFRRELKEGVFSRVFPAPSGNFPAFSPGFSTEVSTAVFTEVSRRFFTEVCAEVFPDGFPDGPPGNSAGQR